MFETTNQTTIKKTSAPRVYMQNGNATWKIYILQIWKNNCTCMWWIFLDFPFPGWSRNGGSMKCTVTFSWASHGSMDLGESGIVHLTSSHLVTSFTQLYILGWLKTPPEVGKSNEHHHSKQPGSSPVSCCSTTKRCAARDSLKFGINEQSCLTCLLTLHHGTWNTWRLRRRNLMGTWEPDPAIGDLPLPLPQKKKWDDVHLPRSIAGRFINVYQGD